MIFFALACLSCLSWSRKVQTAFPTQLICISWCPQNSIKGQVHRGLETTWLINKKLKEKQKWTLFFTYFYGNKTILQCNSTWKESSKSRDKLQKTGTKLCIKWANKKKYGVTWKQNRRKCLDCAQMIMCWKSCTALKERCRGKQKRFISQLSLKKPTTL